MFMNKDTCLEKNLDQLHTCKCKCMYMYSRGHKKVNVS